MIRCARLRTRFSGLAQETASVGFQTRFRSFGCPIFTLRFSEALAHVRVVRRAGAGYIVSGASLQRCVVRAREERGQRWWVHVGQRCYICTKYCRVVLIRGADQEGTKCAVSKTAWFGGFDVGLFATHCCCCCCCTYRVSFGWVRIQTHVCIRGFFKLWPCSSRKAWARVTSLLWFVAACRGRCN